MSGLRVFATARSQTVLEELSALGIETLALDVTSPASIKEVKSEVESRTGGGLDYLVNNAYVVFHHRPFFSIFEQ